MLTNANITGMMLSHARKNQGHTAVNSEDMKMAIEYMTIKWDSDTKEIVDFKASSTDVPSVSMEVNYGDDGIGLMIHPKGVNYTSEMYTLEMRKNEDKSK